MVIEAYFDDTGTHNGAEVTATAGYLANAELWSTFTAQWCTVLESHGLAYFRMADFEATEGLFKGWCNDQKLALISQLLPIIPHNTFVGMGYGILRTDYDAIMKGHPEMARLLGEPYTLCCFKIIEQLATALPNSGSRDYIAYFHDRTDKYKGEIEKAFDWIKRGRAGGDQLIGTTFGSKTDFVPLQAADVLAYETKQRLVGMERRRSMEALRKRDSVRITFLDRENLLGILARLQSLVGL